MSPTDFGERYQMIRMLGEGGMGKVMLAEDQETGRQVAVKLLRFDPRENEEYLQRLQVEARAQARVRHPNLVQIYDCQLERSPAYLVMEYVDGYVLADRIRKKGPMPPRRAARVIRGMARAVSALHKEGVLHRDLKPANVMVRADDGEAVVMDLGLARIEGGPQLTKTGNFVGTPVYLPPEVIMDSRWERASDQFQLGAVLFELLTGRTMVQVRTMEELFHGCQEERTLTWGSLDIPDDLKSIVKRAVRADPADRFQDVDAFERALADFEEGRLRRFTATLSHLDLPRPAKQGALAGIALLVLLSLVSGFLIGEDPRPEDLRWRVVGDAVMVEFRNAGADGLQLRLDGEAVETERRDGPGGTRFIHRGLGRGKRVMAQLAWRGGESPRLEVEGGEIAVGPDARLEDAHTLVIRVERPCTTWWEGTHRKFELQPGEGRLALGDEPASELRLVVEEEGLRFLRVFRRDRVAAGTVARLIGRVGEADVVEELRRSYRENLEPPRSFAELRAGWEPLVPWLPRLLSGDISGLDVARLWKAWQIVDRSAAQERFLGVDVPDMPYPEDVAGSRRWSLPPGVPMTALPREPIDVPEEGIEDGTPPRFRIANMTKGMIPTNVTFEAGRAVRVTWPDGGPPEPPFAWFAVSLEKFNHDEQILLRVGEGNDMRDLAHLRFPVHTPGVRREPKYAGWVAVALPGPLLPAPGERVTLVLRSLLTHRPLTVRIGSVRVGWPAGTIRE